MSTAKPRSSSRIFQSEILTRPMFLPSREVFLVFTSFDRDSIVFKSGLRLSFGFEIDFGLGFGVTGVAIRFDVDGGFSERLSVRYLGAEVFDGFSM